MGKLLLAIFLTLTPLLVWAVDTDMDGLPDDWEVANGRDPDRPDYLIAAIHTEKTFSVNGSYKGASVKESVYTQ